MRYELIREIFNKCSGNQMRDVFVSTVETDDTEAYLRSMLAGKEITINASETGDGVVYDVETDGLLQRFTFTED